MSKFALEDNKLFFLRLFNKCFTNNLGRESFQSFVNIIKKEGMPVLIEDKILVNLVLKKCFKLRNEITQIFIVNMLDIFKNTNNLRFFFETELSLDFLDFCYQNTIQGIYKHTY